MWSSSKIFISKQSIHNNIQFIKNMIGEQCTLSAVVKGNAYGHGIEQYVPIAEEAGVHHFSVFSATEAYRTHQCSEQESSIMVLGYLEDEALEWAIEHGIEFYIFEWERLEKSVEIAKKVGKAAKIHVELETGMNRTGFMQHELETIVSYLKKAKAHLEFKGFCTHYAGAESFANYYRVLSQIQNYKRAVEYLKEQGIQPELYHTACSAAMLSFPETRMDLVRVGILQYGFWPNKETLIRCLSEMDENRDPLQRAISWKSRVLTVKKIEKGSFVGYGTSFLAETDMTIVTVPVGYAYGYARSLSNTGRVLIHGIRVGVIGTVNMNMIVVDVTNIENVKKGDEVVLIGNQGDISVSVDSFGDLSSQLNYELLTRLPVDIPRVVID